MDQERAASGIIPLIFVLIILTTVIYFTPVTLGKMETRLRTSDINETSTLYNESVPFMNEFTGIYGILTTVPYILVGFLVILVVVLAVTAARGR